jgi:hypothetical protein
MKHGIPSTIGLLTLSATALGCSDAQKLGNAYESICKAQCECPEAEEDWDDISNCKTACEGYAKLVEAEAAERDDEPCGDFNKILGDLKDCKKESCGDDRDECLFDQYERLYECWPYEYDNYYYQLPDLDEAVADKLAEIPQSIPRPLLKRALYSALRSELEDAKLEQAELDEPAQQ